ncbi:MAG: SLBB domain-containing protein [Candidatus Hydrothermae bacterium]|nr:SLBB domain-containing protein [Candidatus Hydrothermae bacterium]
MTFLVFFALVMQSAGDIRILPPEQGGGVEIRVHVWGEVQHPGFVWIHQGATLMDAISAAGGPTDRANWKYVRWVSARTGKVEVVNLGAYLGHPKPEGLPRLSPGDVVVVGKTATARWMQVLSVMRDVAIVMTAYLTLRNRF